MCTLASSPQTILFARISHQSFGASGIGHTSGQYSMVSPRDSQFAAGVDGTSEATPPGVEKKIGWGEILPAQTGLLWGRWRGNSFIDGTTAYYCRWVFRILPEPRPVLEKIPRRPPGTHRQNFVHVDGVACAVSCDQNSGTRRRLSGTHHQNLEKDRAADSGEASNASPGQPVRRQVKGTALLVLPPAQ